MARANISVTENQFRCAICLDLLTEPVSIPCGHTYCLVCIRDYWDRTGPGRVSCPQCREAFSPRPVLRRNTVLAELVDRLKLTEPEQDPEQLVGAAAEVPCDFCPAGGRQRAVRSCLVCLASFCDLHGQPHREVGTLRRHRLVPAVERLPERLCAQHRLGLEPPGAGAGWSGDCLLCEADQDELPPVDFQRSHRQLQLQQTLGVLQGRIQREERDLEEFQQNLDSLKVCATGILEDSESLFSDIILCLDKTKAEVRARLEGRGQVVVSRGERDLDLMEKEVEELRVREGEIQQLLQSEDPQHFLKVAPLLCVASVSGRTPRVPSLPTDPFSSTRRSLGLLRSTVEELCREEVDKISRTVSENSGSTGEEVKAPLSSVCVSSSDQRIRTLFLRFWCRLSLDPDTAHPTLVLLDGRRSARCGEEPQAYPPHPQRFDSVAQVLCKEGQFGAASYWEVEWRGGGWVDIGVTYRAIGRKGGGKPCLLGRNDNSWRLRCTHAGYAAWHDNRKTTVAAPPCPRIGVFLERHKEALSFYSVSDAVLLLHTFHCPFSQPLYPAFRLDLDSSLSLAPAHHT